MKPFHEFVARIFFLADLFCPEYIYVYLKGLDSTTRQPEII